MSQPPAQPALTPRFCFSSLALRGNYPSDQPSRAHPSKPSVLTT